MGLARVQVDVVAHGLKANREIARELLADLAHKSRAHVLRDLALFVALAMLATLAGACQTVDPQTLLPELVGVLEKGPLRG